MKVMHILIVLFLCVGFNSAFADNGPRANPIYKDRKNADKQRDKAEKAALKQRLKEERAECKPHPHTVACNDLKERQRIEKRQFKAGQRSDQWAQNSSFKGLKDKSK